MCVLSFHFKVSTTNGTKCTLASKMAAINLLDARGDMREDTNIKGADTESDFWLIIYSVTWRKSGPMFLSIGAKYLVMLGPLTW